MLNETGVLKGIYDGAVTVAWTTLFVGNTSKG